MPGGSTMHQAACSRRLAPPSIVPTATAQTGPSWTRIASSRFRALPPPLLFGPSHPGSRTSSSSQGWAGAPVLNQTHRPGHPAGHSCIVRPISCCLNKLTSQARILGYKSTETKESMGDKLEANIIHIKFSVYIGLQQRSTLKTSHEHGKPRR